jgi:hypothetical protein
MFLAMFNILQRIEASMRPQRIAAENSQLPAKVREAYKLQ